MPTAGCLHKGKGDSKMKVYVCVEETVDYGRRVAKVVTDLEVAREWIRNEYTAFKGIHPEHANPTAYNWCAGADEYGHREWSCWLDYESYGWYVTEIELDK